MVPDDVARDVDQQLAQTQIRIRHLEAIVAGRSDIIQQAVGIVRSRTGGSADEAFGVLRRISQTSHIKVAAAAQNLVDEAVGRARNRH